ncbi:MAG: hypothetical protein H0W24_12575 [Lysobacter sp.]|nr:hypothetical protein [Lysobacter sp.]
MAVVLAGVPPPRSCGRGAGKVQKCDAFQVCSAQWNILVAHPIYAGIAIIAIPTHAVFQANPVTLSSSELLLLDFLSAVDTGKCMEDEIPTDGLIAQGYIVPVGGRVCLTVAGVAKLWSLRERQCASRIVRQNASHDAGIVMGMVQCLRGVGQLA